MAMPYHEPYEKLPVDAQNLHRALSSLIEELEAVNWYNERVNVSQDPELNAVLAHNRDEEIEHASMILEWIRRRVPKFDVDLHTYLFTSKPIAEIETAAESLSSNRKKAPA
jgi:hypothetical protein